MKLYQIKSVKYKNIFHRLNRINHQICMRYPAHQIIEKKYQLSYDHNFEAHGYLPMPFI